MTRVQTVYVLYLLKRAHSVHRWTLNTSTAIESTQYEPGHSESTNLGKREAQEVYVVAGMKLFYEEVFGSASHRPFTMFFPS